MKKTLGKKTGPFVWLRPCPSIGWFEPLPNGLKYHLWRSGPGALRSLCGSMKALEGKVMIRPWDSQQDNRDWSLCVRCRNLIPQEAHG